MYSEFKAKVKDQSLWSIVNTAPKEPIVMSLDFETKLQSELKLFANIVEKMSHKILKSKQRIADLQILEPLKNTLQFKNQNLLTHPVFRVDAFIDSETSDLSILEINASDPSAISWHDDLLRSCISNSIFNKRIWNCHWLVQAHAANTKKCYQINCASFNIAVKEVPWIVFVIELKSFVLHDFYHLAQKYWEMGFKACLLSPEELADIIVNENEKPDIIYTDSLFDIYGEPDSDYVPSTVLVEYLESNKTLVLNPTTSLIAEQKNFLAMVSEEGDHDFFSETEKNLIQRVVPWTRRLTEASDIIFCGESFSFFHELLSEKKDQLVLKPSYGYGGEGVYLGMGTPASEWARIVHKICSENESYIVQEYIEGNKIELSKGNDSKLKECSEYNIVYSFWVIDGVFSGAFARYSKDTIVNVTKDAGMLPIVFSAESILG